MELVNALFALILVGAGWVLTVELLKLGDTPASAAAVSPTGDAVDAIDVAKRNC